VAFVWHLCGICVAFVWHQRGTRFLHEYGTFFTLGIAGASPKLQHVATFLNIFCEKQVCGECLFLWCMFF